MGSSNTKSFSLTKSPTAKPNKDSTVMAGNDDYVEAVVCKDSDIKENEMKSFDIGDAGKVLVIRQGGTLSAIGNKCSHYGAPLVSGALGQGRVRCPWHGACFNIKTGDIEDYPGLDSLPCYQVTVMDDGQVKVKAKKSELQANRRVKKMTKRSHQDDTVYVLVGGGPSSAACAETLRQNNFMGRIIIVGKENTLPYDRVKISKALDSDITKLQLRNEEFYSKNDIEVIKGIEVVKVDCDSKTVRLSTGNRLNYTYLYLATGCRSRKLPIVGNDVKNVFTIRSFSDALDIDAAIGAKVDKNIVILGGGFIGMEAAVYCVGKTKSITVVARDDVPFQSVFGPHIGYALMKLFEDKGVVFKMNNNISMCYSEKNKICSVELTDGSILPADILLMGVGSLFNTEFLEGSGVDVNEDGSVPVNDKMQTNIQGIFAGGDIANAPVYSHGKKAAIGHFGLAHYHGRIAALNMLNKNAPLKAVPFFWTVLFGKSIRYCGHGKFNDILIDGDLEALKFVAFYFDKEDKVIAMASCMRDPIVAQFAEYLNQGKTLHRKDLDGDMFSWTKKVATN